MMAKILINRGCIGLSGVLLVVFGGSIASAQSAASDSQVTGSFVSSTRSTAPQQPEFMRRLEKLRQFTEQCLRRDDLPATAEATRFFIEPCINDRLIRAGEPWRWDAQLDDISGIPNARVQRTASEKVDRIR